MKLLLLTTALLLSLLAYINPVNAQAVAETINLMGDDYLVSKDLPEEILGLYKYEEKGEPIVQINADGTGLFQPHMVSAFPIKIWIHVDESGVPHRQVGSELRYRYTLLFQYGEGGGGNYPANDYNLMDVTMLKDEGIAMIWGERIRRL